MKGFNRKPVKPPRRRESAPVGKPNRELTTQTRKVLGRHYAAKYRAR